MSVRTTAGWIVIIIVAFAFLAAGGLKLSGPRMMRDEFALFHLPFWLNYVIGTIEIICAIVLFTRWFGYAAGILTVIGLGAAYEHATHGQTSRAIAPFVLAMLSASCVWLHRNRYAAVSGS